MKKYERPAMRMVEIKQKQMILSGSPEPDPHGGSGSRELSFDCEE